MSTLPGPQYREHSGVLNTPVCLILCVSDRSCSGQIDLSPSQSEERKGGESPADATERTSREVLWPLGMQLPPLHISEH